ncbi:MAG: hypothetical protein NZ898_10570, partial [Myxococcota bacterium]|nr:hypothetical protein [Myxococcota bacterium]
MLAMVVVRAWALVVSLVAHAGCATGGRDTPPATDAGRDTGRDAVMDGTADVESPDARLPCERDEDCDDGLRCSGVERCVEGRCAAGEPVRCDDGVRCTRDECAEPDGTCTSRPDDGACPAGLVCDAADDCVAPRACASDAECDDGMFCNGVERCDPSFGCRRGEPPSCDDGRACTLDRCNPTTDACESLPDDGRCSDGRRCNGVELCRPAEPGADARGCVVGTPVACDDGIACTQDVCDEATGTCRSEPRDAACDDGVFCNGSERCEPMRGCQAGTPPACEDAIGCTRGRCDAATDRCVQEPDDAACQDGLACNGMERCDATGATPGRGCVAGTALRCDDGLACTTDRCVEPGRCEHQGSDADGDG